MFASRAVQRDGNVRPRLQKQYHLFGQRLGGVHVFEHGRFLVRGVAADGHAYHLHVVEHRRRVSVQQQVEHDYIHRRNRV